MLLIALDRHFACDFDTFITTGFALDGALGYAYEAKQAMAVYRFVEKEICAGVERICESCTVVFPGNDYDRSTAVHAGGAHLAGEFDAAGARHMHIEKDRLKFLFGQARGGFFAFGEGNSLHLHGS